MSLHSVFLRASWRRGYEDCTWARQKQRICAQNMKNGKNNTKNWTLLRDDGFRYERGVPVVHYTLFNGSLYKRMEIVENSIQ